MDLTGQVALVTGAGRGLGRAFAVALARSGVAIGALARTAAQVRETTALIERSGGRALPIVADVTAAGALANAVAEVERTFGPLDLLVSAAGIGRPVGPTWEVDPGEWWRTVEVNLRAPFLGVHAALPGMLARGRGRIINVSSGAGNVAIPHLSAYSTSKTALTRG